MKTALRQYQRLESEGLWKADEGAQRKDVTLSFGAATLVINDPAGRALSHWSLAAIHRLNPGQRPAIFAPDRDASETVEISETIMIEAIETIRKSLARAKPRKGRVRRLVNWAGLALLVSLGVFWLPGAITRQTLAVVPPIKRSEIGASVLAHLQSETGAICRNAAAMAALQTLNQRVLGAATTTKTFVLRDGITHGQALPGGINVIGQSALTLSDDPAVAAGEILLAQNMRAVSDPLAPLLEHVGLRATLRLLTTGEVTPADLAQYAQKLLGAQDPVTVDSELIARFDAAGVPLAPLLEHGTDLILSDGLPDPTARRLAPPLLDDQDWVSLQGICNP